MYLHIKDCIEHVSPGGLVGALSDHALYRALARVAGHAAARIVFETVGESGVLALSARELEQLAGIPRAAATRIVAARELGELLQRSTLPRIGGASDILRHLPLGLAALETEVLLGIALNGSLEVRAVVLLAKGGSHSAAITARDLFVPIVRLNTSGLVLVHNHPSGDPTPSNDDVTLTNHATRVGRLLGIQVVDHLIVARGGVASFSELGLLLSERELCSVAVSQEFGGAR